MITYEEIMMNNILYDELLKGENKMSKSYDILNDRPQKAIQFVLAATINVYYYYKEIINKGRESIYSINKLSGLMDEKFDSDDLFYMDRYLQVLEQTAPLLADGLIKEGAKDKIDELCRAFNISPLDLEMQNKRPFLTDAVITTIAKYNDNMPDEYKVSIPYVIEILHRANDEYLYDLEKNSSIGRMPKPDDHDTNKDLKKLAITIKNAFSKVLKNRDDSVHRIMASIAKCLEYPDDMPNNLKEIPTDKHEYGMEDAFKKSIYSACKTYAIFYTSEKKKEPVKLHGIEVDDYEYIEVVSPKAIPASGNKEEKEILHDIEVIARTCYKSEDKMTEDSAEKMVRNLIKSEHMAMLEHATISMIFTCDRGISHEIVRHRMASYAQESTRYCNYSKGKFGHKIKVVDIFKGFGMKSLSNGQFKTWLEACNNAGKSYFDLIDAGAAPQLARDVLPTSTATTIVVTMNIREWRHFFKLRSLGTTGAPHPQMKFLADEALEYMSKNYPVLFGDLVKKEEK